jgi:hypothetical protein
MKMLFMLFLLYLGAYLKTDCADPLPITIWVHGSLVGPSFFMHDFFYRKLGMVHAQDYDPRYHSRDMALYLNKADPSLYPFEHFYFWGWSGKLSQTARKKEAKQLYLDIQKLLKEYKVKYPDRSFFLRLISHSHGGNVLLNLSQAQDDQQALIFDELILLSCPVQHTTKEYVKNACFKKIYSFYSSDLYQIIDFQKIKRNGKTLKMHSGRRFEEIPTLHQAKIKINGWALMHIEFMLDKFLKHIPLLCKEIDIFYENLPAQKQHREKLLHIHYYCNKTRIHQKLF